MKSGWARFGRLLDLGVGGCLFVGRRVIVLAGHEGAVGTGRVGATFHRGDGTP